MKKQEFAIPAVALVLAALLGIYLVINGSRDDQPVPSDTATSTIATSTTDGTDSDGSTSTPARGGYYNYGSVTLPLDKAAGFKSGLSMRVLRVAEDSRCPADVQCVSAGEFSADVRFRTGAGTQEETTWVENMSLGETRVVGGTSVTLSSVVPATSAVGNIAASAYRLTFDVREATAGVTGGCYVGGCSSQLCTDRPDAVSTCEYTEAYGCFKGATCERQATGRCGWTETTELRACLDSAN